MAGERRTPLHHWPQGPAPHCTSAFPSVKRDPILLRPPRVPLSLAVNYRARPLGLALGLGVREERPGPQDVHPLYPNSGLPNLKSGPATHFPKSCDCYILVLASVTQSADTFQNVAFSQVTPSIPSPLHPGPSRGGLWTVRHAGGRWGTAQRTPRSGL